MKIIHSLIRWGGLYLMVAVFVAVFLWENALPISSTNHMLFAIGIFIVFGLCLNSWVSHNETNFLVSKTYLGESKKGSNRYETLHDEEPRLEKKK
jgi:hypothetical protein